MGLFSSNLVGLDIGSSCIKMVQLKPAGKGAWTLVNYGIQELTDEPVEDIDPDLKPTVVADALRKLFKAKKVSGNAVVTAVGGDTVIPRFIKLPFMTTDELKNVISYEAEQHIPLPIDQVVIDFHVLGELEEENQKKLEILLVAAKEEMVDEHIKMLKNAKLKPVIIDVDSFAMGNAYTANNSDEKGETVALINLGAKTSTINLMENGVSHVNRDFSVAGNQFTKEIQREFNLSFAQAEELKRQQGAVVIESDEILLTRMPDKDDRSMRISEAVTPVLNKMLSEFRRSFDFYENSIKGRPVSKVVLSGGGARLRNIEKFFTDKLGVPTELGNPFKKIGVGRGFDAEALQLEAPSLMVSVGLAMRRAGA